MTARRRWTTGLLAAAFLLNSCDTTHKTAARGRPDGAITADMGTGQPALTFRIVSQHVDCLPGGQKADLAYTVQDRNGDGVLRDTASCTLSVEDSATHEKLILNQYASALNNVPVLEGLYKDSTAKPGGDAGMGSKGIMMQADGGEARGRMFQMFDAIKKSCDAQSVLNQFATLQTPMVRALDELPQPK